MSGLSIRARCSLLGLLFVFATSGFARAGDAAYPEALGFSSDGTRFAFAEWGQQDGSGFSYASVYLIDLARDAWITSPIRSLIEDETAPPRRAFTSALKRSEQAIAKAGISHPARVVFARPHTEHSPEPEIHSFAYSPIASLGAFRQQHRIGVSAFEIKTENCPDPAFGFALSWNAVEIYRDAALSKSRGCPIGYSVERVFLPDSIFQSSYGVALIGVYRLGFEGPDMRHIAIPIPLDQ